MSERERRRRTISFGSRYGERGRCVLRLLSSPYTPYSVSIPEFLRFERDFARADRAAPGPKFLGPDTRHPNDEWDAQRQKKGSTKSRKMPDPLTAARVPKQRSLECWLPGRRRGGLAPQKPTNAALSINPFRAMRFAGHASFPRSRAPRRGQDEDKKNGAAFGPINIQNPQGLG